MVSKRPVLKIIVVSFFLQECNLILILFCFVKILDGGNRHLYQSSMCFPPFISTTNVVQLILNVDGIVPSYSGFQLIFQGKTAKLYVVATFLR